MDPEAKERLLPSSCPKCGSHWVLAIHPMLCLIWDDKGGMFVAGRPYGTYLNPSVSVNSDAICNKQGCGWEGKLKEALPPRNADELPKED